MAFEGITDPGIIEALYYDTPQGEETMGIENRGFASMSMERRREIASLGGRAAHAAGTAHRWTSAEASEAGRKGGRANKVVEADFSVVGEISN